MTRLLTLLVRALPAPFRARFESDMVEQIRTDYARARAHGRIRAFAFGTLTALDLVKTAAAEYWRPSWVNGAEASPGYDGRGSMKRGWTQDLRQAARSLRRSPGFAVVTIGTLGLAVGVNAGIFSVVDAVLLHPLPYTDADRLVYVSGSAPGSGLPDEFTAFVESYLQYDDESELLDDVAAYDDFTNTLRVGDRVERPRMALATPSLFHTLGVTPLIGRLPVPEDEERVAVISHALWTSWFGSDPSVLGRAYSIAGADRTIIGVMGPDFWFPNDETRLWIPLTIRPEELGLGRERLAIVGRMAPDVEEAELTAELTRLARRLPERVGGSPAYAELMGLYQPIVRPVEQQLLGDIAGPLWLLLGSVGIVLLIACANVANLFVVRAERRQRDLAVRRAIGAGRPQLIRSQMAEAVLVAGSAGVLAVLLAWLSVPAFLSLAPPDVPRLDEAGVGVATLVFSLAASALAAVLCGLVPAVRASAPDLTRLREAGRGATSGGHWGRGGLVAAQTALALTLLIGSALLVRSFWALRSVDPGFDVTDVFTFQIAPEGDHLTDAASYARFHMSFMERVAALPGVESVGVVENLPLNEGLSRSTFRPDRTTGTFEADVPLAYTWAAGDYFEAMGIELLRGRAFTREDEIGGLGNVIVSRSAAELLWPGQDPIGRRLRAADADAWETVVGVVEDVRQDGFRGETDALVYFPLVGQPGGGMEERAVTSPAYVVETRRADEIGPEVRALVREAAPNAPMYRVFTMEGLARDSMIHLSFTMLTLGVAAALALTLGAVGLYGVLSYVVAQRTREIGVRMALGADASRVRRMVVAEGVGVVGVGVVLGILAALAATRVLASLLFGVQAVDVLTFASMAAATLAVGLTASYLPARRASLVDPIRSLRGE